MLQRATLILTRLRLCLFYSPVCARRVQKVHRDILRLEVVLKRLGEDADSKLAAAKKNDILTLMTSDSRVREHYTDTHTRTALD